MAQILPGKDNFVCGFRLIVKQDWKKLGFYEFLKVLVFLFYAFNRHTG